MINKETFTVGISEDENVVIYIATNNYIVDMALFTLPSHGSQRSPKEYRYSAFESIFHGPKTT